MISDVQTDEDRTGPVMVKGFATIDNVALINVEGTGMVGVQGTASAIFTTVRDANANVIMISQASSEHSVCFAVKQAEGDRAVKALNARCAPVCGAVNGGELGCSHLSLLISINVKKLCQRSVLGATLVSYAGQQSF